MYRRQGLSKVDFENMSEIKGRLNNFLSMSNDHNASLGFANSGMAKSEMIGILFVMIIDPKKSTIPFALITGVDTTSKIKKMKSSFSCTRYFASVEILVSFR
jgi:hypothetical protein